MKAKDIPKTPAVRFLLEKGVEFIPKNYKYVEKGGTRTSAESLSVDEHMIIKTLVFEMPDERNKPTPIIVLMHGDKEVSAKEMARFLNVKSVDTASEKDVTKYTGYQTGGTSPFGTRQKIPVYVESTIFDLDKIFINGGKRGFLVEINPSVLKILLPIVPVNVAV